MNPFDIYWSAYNAYVDGCFKAYFAPWNEYMDFWARRL